MDAFITGIATVIIFVFIAVVMKIVMSAPLVVMWILAGLLAVTAIGAIVNKIFNL